MPSFAVPISREQFGDSLLRAGREFETASQSGGLKHHLDASVFLARKNRAYDAATKSLCSRLVCKQFAACFSPFDYDTPRSFSRRLVAPVQSDMPPIRFQGTIFESVRGKLGHRERKPAAQPKTQSNGSVVFTISPIQEIDASSY
jgi:hypothetical protein